MKTYLCRFTYKYGNGFALVSSNRIASIESILINQGHYEGVHLVDCKELNICVPTCGPQIITAGNITTVGSSAYDLAVTLGFEGTEQEWIASLKGDKGDKGDTGETGSKGDSGVWYGTTTPPAGYDVWIDPSGDTLDMGSILKGRYKTVTATSNIVASESPASGMETDVLYVNNSGSTITVTASAQIYRTPNGNDLVIQVSPGMYGEINYTNINGVIYVRGA